MLKNLEQKKFERLRKTKTQNCDYLQKSFTEKIPVVRKLV
jgi:hypothetical protein